MRFSAQHQPCGSVRSDGCLSKYCQVIGLLADTEMDFLFFSLLILLFFHWKNFKKKKKKKQVVTVKLAFVTSVLTCFFYDVTEGSSEEETSAISFTLVPAYCMSTLLPLSSPLTDLIVYTRKQQQQQKLFLYAVMGVLAGEQGWNQRWLQRTLWWWIRKNCAV